MSRIEILIACHKESEVLRSNVFRPIQVGTDLPGHPYLADMYHDNTGDNISSLNESYCELTAQYWAWKNLDLDYYGFCHYRRYFNFSVQQDYPGDQYHNIIEPWLGKDAIRKYQMNDDAVQRLAEQYDVVLTDRKDLNWDVYDGNNPYDQYRNAELLHGKDIDILLDIIKTKSPEYQKAAEEYMSGHSTYFCNMYIMKKEYFFEYCTWMFGILSEFCKRSDMTHYSTEARRTPGHLSERLLNIYLLYLRDKKPDLKVKELQCVVFIDTDPIHRTIVPAFEAKDTVPVVVPAGHEEAPKLAVCIQSILDHADQKRHYDLLVMDHGISEEDKAKFRFMVSGSGNVSIRFCNPHKLLVEQYHVKNDTWENRGEYDPFILLDVLQGYDKWIQIDNSTIFMDDPANLFETDLQQSVLAAAESVSSAAKANGYQKGYRTYLQNDLKLHDAYAYFDSGVMVINAKAMRERCSAEQWLCAIHDSMKNPAQDVLNQYCEGKVAKLDLRWNVLCNADTEGMKHMLMYAPDEIQKDVRRAEKLPGILHYTGIENPWNCRVDGLIPEFWQELRKTPFYEGFYFRVVSNSVSSQNRMPPISDDRKSLVDTCFPRGTERREKLDSIYVKLFHKD